MPLKKRYCLLLLISVGVVALLCYFLMPSQNESCIVNYANEINVDPNRVAVTNKIYNSVIPQLSNEMTAIEVHQIFNKAIPTEFSRQGKTLDGGYQEIAFLKLCPSVALDTILIDYSKDGFFVRARLYFGD